MIIKRLRENLEDYKRSRQMDGLKEAKLEETQETVAAVLSCNGALKSEN